MSYRSRPPGRPGIPVGYLAAAAPAASRRPVLISDRMLVLDHARAVILDLTAAPSGWDGFCAEAARRLAWPSGCRIEVDQHGRWAASVSGPGCRWTSWCAPDVCEMVTRAAGCR